MKFQKEYTIDFSGLKQGVYQFDFNVGKAFFSIFENEEYNDAEFKVSLALEKQSTMMLLDFSIQGKVNVDCDRCLEPVDIEVECEEHLIVKFGEEMYEGTDEIVILPESEHQIDVSPYIYEFIQINIPQSRKHKKSECNPEVIKKLKEIEVKNTKQKEAEIDPRWAQLINLKTEN